MSLQPAEWWGLTEPPSQIFSSSSSNFYLFDWLSLFLFRSLYVLSGSLIHCLTVGWFVSFSFFLCMWMWLCLLYIFLYVFMILFFYFYPLFTRRVHKKLLIKMKKKVLNRWVMGCQSLDLFLFSVNVENSELSFI